MPSGPAGLNRKLREISTVGVRCCFKRLPFQTTTARIEPTWLRTTFTASPGCDVSSLLFGSYLLALGSKFNKGIFFATLRRGNDCKNV